jgi:hypothetical protein
MEMLMNAVKYNKGGKLKVSTATKSVPAPSGFHWMVDRGRYFLMKGDYKPHPGAVKEAKSMPKVKKRRDACYHKVKSRYKVWPSAYASGALAKCRKVGVKNWGNGGKKN